MICNAFLVCDLVANYFFYGIICWIVESIKNSNYQSALSDGEIFIRLVVRVYKKKTKRMKAIERMKADERMKVGSFTKLKPDRKLEIINK